MSVYVMWSGWDEGAFIYETSKQGNTTGKTRKNDQGSNVTQGGKGGRDRGPVRREGGVGDEVRNKNRECDVGMC